MPLLATKKQSQFKAKQSQFPKRQKMNVTSFITKDYENVPTHEGKKTKPNQTQFPKGQGHFTGTVADGKETEEGRWKEDDGRRIAEDRKQKTQSFEKGRNQACR